MIVYFLMEWMIASQFCGAKVTKPTEGSSSKINPLSPPIGGWPFAQFQRTQRKTLQGLNNCPKLFG